MIFWERFVYHQNTVKILSHQYVGMFAVVNIFWSPMSHKIYFLCLDPEFGLKIYFFCLDPELWLSHCGNIFLHWHGLRIYFAVGVDSGYISWTTRGVWGPSVKKKLVIFSLLGVYSGTRVHFQIWKVWLCKKWKIAIKLTMLGVLFQGPGWISKYGKSGYA